MTKIVFFDGVCNMCNGTVDILMHIDKTGQFKFASLQGETAKTILKDTPLLDSIVYFRNGTLFQQSNAVAEILIDLGGIHTVLGKVLLLVPKIIRNFFYSIIAKNRYSIFGKRDTCRMPTPEERSRLLD